MLGYSVVTCLPAVHKRDDLRLFACFLISPRLKLAEVFAGSPWLTREEQGQQLAELAALFYDCRAELPDSLPDGWLLEQMRRAFDGSCRGCMELMNDCFLLQLPQHLRQSGRPEDFGWR